ncbi:type VI secretion system baseplate subunit TssG [Massilia sp. CMS3.1]|uniref:type VI secretion system baseplate subunit TssG n=1 Tax=Massilia sp. CMS3.1 TaxID=3373083 RepID=UPI003EE43E8B
MPDILSRLLRDPQHFNLFQAISLLERAAPDRAQVGAGVGMDEAVRLAAHVDMAFAPSDIASLRPGTGDGPAWILRTPAMTLAGGQGPLATPFTELLIEQRRQRNPSGLDLLDMFNGRLLAFRHRARARQHLALAPGGTSPVTVPGQAPMAPLLRTVDALSGLGRGRGAHGPLGELGWLRHAGLQNAAPRSMTSLLTLLRDRFGVHFTGRQFVGGWHRLAPGDQARLLGRGTHRHGGQSTGMGASLGARAWDQAAGMALTAPPLAAAQFAALLPGGAQFALLGWLVARHLQADFTVTLTLSLAAAPATRLGRKPAQAFAPRLGRSAWLCSRNRAGRSEHDYQHARFVLSAPNANDIKGA